MASTYIFVIMAICAVQFAQSADVEKRGLFDSIPLVGPLVQQAVDQVTSATTSFVSNTLSTLGGGVTQAQTIAQNYSDQATVVNDAAKGPLESLLKAATDEIQSIVDNSVQYGWNSTLCVAGQTGNAESIVKRAAKDIFGCTQTAIQQTFELLADITSLNDQGIALARSMPSQFSGCISWDITGILSCVQSASSTILSRYLLLLSSQLGDIYTLTVQGIGLPENLTRCGADQILKATGEVGVIISNAGECMKQVASNS